MKNKSDKQIIDGLTARNLEMFDDNRKLIKELGEAVETSKQAISLSEKLVADNKHLVKKVTMLEQMLLEANTPKETE